MEINKKYPPPTKPKFNKEFANYWNLFINKVVTRENFHEGHLAALRILCDYHVEYDLLTDQLMEEGHYFENTNDRHGDQIKMHPLVAIREKVTTQIHRYYKFLGLVLEKDRTRAEEPGDDDWA